MEPLIASTWQMMLMLAFGVGAGLLAYYVKHWEAHRNLRDFEGWLVEIEECVHEVIRTDGRAAAAKAVMFELMGKLPDDFDPTVFLTVNIGEQLQRCVLLEAERRGRVTPGTFERMFGVPIVEAVSADAVAQASGAPARSESLPGSGAWIGTHRVSKQSNGASAN